MLKWREIQKLKGTYVDALPALVNLETGRVHTTFNQAVAATGRLSSSDPNLQNIPIRTPLGREIRARVRRRARVRADLGRLLADRAARARAPLRRRGARSTPSGRASTFTTGRPSACSARTSGLDPPRAAPAREDHQLRAALRQDRVHAREGHRRARRQAAQEFIDAYFAGFPAVRAFIDQTLDDARATGVVRTMTGRRRLVPELSSKNGQVRAAAERETVNMPIQGTAADILKKAMIDVHAALEALQRRPADAERG